MNMTPRLKIGAVSKLLGVSTQTLREWHKRKLLIPQVNELTKIRYYSVEDVDRFLGEIKADNKKKELGSSLKINDAAMFLGVTPTTLRSWHKMGKLVPEVNKFKTRIYDLAFLETWKADPKNVVKRGRPCIEK